MERSLTSACLQRRKMTSSPEEQAQLPFQRVLIGLHPLPSRFQVLKLKISKPLEILVIFSEVAIKRLVLASAKVVVDTSILFLFTHERNFIELVFTHLHGTSTSLFLYVYILSTSVSQEWIFSGSVIFRAFA